MRPEVADGCGRTEGTMEDGTTGGKRICGGKLLLARGENCKNRTLIVALCIFAIPNIVFVKIGLQTSTT